MGRKRKNARARVKARPLHVNKYMEQKGRKKASVSPVITENTELTPVEQTILTLRKTERFYPRQFEIWFAELGTHYGMSIQGGCRPVLIVSNDVANRHSSTLTVIPMTSKVKKMHLPTHVLITAADCTPLKAERMLPSVILAEQVITIDKSMLRSLLARLDNEQKKDAVKAALDTQFWLEEHFEPISQTTNTETSTNSTESTETRGEHNGS